MTEEEQAFWFSDGWCRFKEDGMTMQDELDAELYAKAGKVLLVAAVLALGAYKVWNEHKWRRSQERQTIALEELLRRGGLTGTVSTFIQPPACSKSSLQ